MWWIVGSLIAIYLVFSIFDFESWNANIIKDDDEEG